jgi:hypothetical protein
VLRCCRATIGAGESAAGEEAHRRAHRHAGYGVIDDGRERSTRLLWYRKKVTRRVTNTNRVTRTISLTVSRTISTTRQPHSQQHDEQSCQPSPGVEERLRSLQVYGEAAAKPQKSRDSSLCRLIR